MVKFDQICKTAKGAVCEDKVENSDGELVRCTREASKILRYFPGVTFFYKLVCTECEEAIMCMKSNQEYYESDDIEFAEA